MLKMKAISQNQMNPKLSNFKTTINQIIKLPLFALPKMLITLILMVLQIKEYRTYKIWSKNTKMKIPKKIRIMTLT